MRRAGLIALVLAGSACRCGSTGVCGPRGDEVRIALATLPNTLDWSASSQSSAPNYPVIHAMMRGLTALGRHDEVVPALAASWEVTTVGAPPRQVYTFHLRRDLVWSDGKTPLTAEDFVFGWRRALLGNEPETMLDIAGARAVLEARSSRVAPAAVHARIAQALTHFAVKALDAHTLQVTLRSPKSYFLARVAYVYPFFPEPSADLLGRTPEEIRRYFNSPSHGRPLVLGAFRVVRWDRLGRTVRLEENPFDHDVPARGRVKSLLLVQAALSPILYDHCRIDFALMDDPSMLASPPPDLRHTDLLSTYWLGMNTTLVPLPLRQAIAHAIDRQALMKGLLPQVRLATTYLPPGMPGAPDASDPQLKTYPRYDPGLAKGLLASPGESAVPSSPASPERSPTVLGPAQSKGGARDALPTPPFDSAQGTRDIDQAHSRAASLPAAYHGQPLTLLVRDSNTFLPEVAIAEGIREQLEAVGIDVRVQETSNFTNDIQDAGGRVVVPLFLKRVGADYAHPQTMLTPFQANGVNYTDFAKLDGGKEEAKLDALLDAGAATTDPAAMRRIYGEADALLVRDDVVMVPLFYPDRYYRIRPWLAGLGVDSFNFLTLRSMHFVKSEPKPLGFGGRPFEPRVEHPAFWAGCGASGSRGRRLDHPCRNRVLNGLFAWDAAIGEAGHVSVRVQAQRPRNLGGDAGPLVRQVGQRSITTESVTVPACTRTLACPAPTTRASCARACASSICTRTLACPAPTTRPSCARACASSICTRTLAGPAPTTRPSCARACASSICTQTLACPAPTTADINRLGVALCAAPAALR